MPSKRYRQVFSLHISPDFSEVQSGRKPPPYVDYERVDHEALSAYFAQNFDCGERVRICVADDAVDQVTLHMRMARAGGLHEGMTEDFAEALLAKATGTRTVANVRADWQALHHLKNRKNAPPPCILMFVVEGTFQAVMLWSHQMMMGLGIRAADITYALDGKKPLPQDHEGHLPLQMREMLGRLYGTPFEAFCLLQQMKASSPPPEWVAQYKG